jgi:hypothetical protein
MKKLILLLIIVSLLPLSGCVSAGRAERRKRTEGWEYVRIERRVPDKNCIYKIQDVCGEKSASKCYNWYKKRAKFYGANTVVITEDIRDRTAIAGSPSPIAPLFKSSATTEALADYYDCPNCEPETQK